MVGELEERVEAGHEPQVRVRPGPDPARELRLGINDGNEIPIS